MRKKQVPKQNEKKNPPALPALSLDRCDVLYRDQPSEQRPPQSPNYLLDVLPLREENQYSDLKEENIA